MIELTQKQVAECHALCAEFPLIHKRLMDAGLYATAKEFQTGAMHKIGWELAERLSERKP